MATYTVEKGDSIWSIAERSLGMQMPGQPITTEQVANEMLKIISLNMPKLKVSKTPGTPGPADLIYSGLVLEIGGAPTPGEAIQGGKSQKPGKSEGSVSKARADNAEDNGASPGQKAQYPDLGTAGPVDIRPPHTLGPQDFAPGTRTLGPQDFRPGGPGVAGPGAAGAPRPSYVPGSAGTGGVYGPAIPGRAASSGAPQAPPAARRPTYQGPWRAPLRYTPAPGSSSGKAQYPSLRPAPTVGPENFKPGNY